MTRRKLHFAHAYDREAFGVFIRGSRSACGIVDAPRKTAVAEHFRDQAERNPAQTCANCLASLDGRRREIQS